MDEYEVEAISESRRLLRTGMALLQKMVQEGPDSSAFYSLRAVRIRRFVPVTESVLCLHSCNEAVMHS